MQRTLLLLATCWVGTALLTGCGAARKPRTSKDPVGAAAREAAAREKARGAIGEAAPPVPAVADDKPAPRRGIEWPVTGWGLNQAEAEADALKRATKKLTEYLQNLTPPLAVTLTPAYVRQHLIHGDAERRQDLEKDIGKVNEAIKMQCWSLTLAVTPEDYAGFVQRDRQVRIEQERSGRMLLMAHVLAGALALLFAVIGYLRFKEWACCTRRVRSPRENLRAAKAKVLAVACVLLVALIGLWFLVERLEKLARGALPN